jgi:BirA family transcriptional regulator, biotin operon repressor / biotin---[acetyl-CoA-carboxylase] ligase
LVGIGINVRTGSDDLPPGATSLHVATGVAAESEQVFKVVLNQFDEVYADYVASQGRPSLARWRARAALLGEIVTVEDGNGCLTGIFTDVDDDGALLIEDSGRCIHKVVAGDLVRGPRRVGGALGVCR